MSIDINIHRVTKVEILTREHKDKKYPELDFATRELMIWDEDGSRVSITLFAPDIDLLKAEL